MDPNTLAPKVAAATLASAHAGNRNLSTGAKLRHKQETSAMLAGPVCEGMKLEDFGWYLGFCGQRDVKLHSGAGVGMARVARFVLGQNDIRDCVPFLINRENVIQGAA